MAIVDPLLLTEALPLEFPLRRLHGGLDRRGGGEHLGGGGVNGKTHIHHHVFFLFWMLAYNVRPQLDNYVGL